MPATVDENTAPQGAEVVTLPVKSSMNLVLRDVGASADARADADSNNDESGSGAGQGPVTTKGSELEEQQDAEIEYEAVEEDMEEANEAEQVDDEDHERVEDDGIEDGEEEEEEGDDGVDMGDTSFSQVILPSADGKMPFRLIRGQRVELSYVEAHNLFDALKCAMEFRTSVYTQDTQDAQDEEEEYDSDELEIEGGPEYMDQDMDDDEADDDDESANAMSSSEDEEFTMEDRADSDNEAVAFEIGQLYRSVPKLVKKYKLVDRLGEGTFSSVYKAVDLRHDAYANQSWFTPQTVTSKGGRRVYVALKRIYVTSSPVRIQNELELLAQLRGDGHVAHIIEAIRHEDQVIAVMPYVRHQDFRTYYRTATLPLIRSYMYSLLRGLSATHKKQIVHRDVKPANFLFDTTTGVGVLCDFGLAQALGGDECYDWRGQCCHSLPGPEWVWPDGRERASTFMKQPRPGSTRAPGLFSGLHGVRLPRPMSLYSQAIAMEADWLAYKRRAVAANGAKAGAQDRLVVNKMKPWIMPNEWRADIESRSKEQSAFFKTWTVPQQGASALGSNRPGVLKEDRRPSVRANRAGTRGFRAPEVLLKCPDQTVAIDVWSAGIILLCFLTRRFPFFNSNDDIEALAEIVAIFGSKKMERCATLHNRTFISNIPEYESPPHPTLQALVKALNPPIFVENSPNPYGPIPSSSADDVEWYDGSELQAAIDLLKRCLELDCTRRWTASELLRHPFFGAEGALYDIGNGELRETPRLPDEDARSS